MTPKGNPTPRNNPPNTVTNVPSDPDSYPTLLDYSSLDSYDSSDNDYSKKMRHIKNAPDYKEFQRPYKKCARLTSKPITDAYK